MLEIVSFTFAHNQQTTYVSDSVTIEAHPYGAMLFMKHTATLYPWHMIQRVNYAITPPVSFDFKE